MAEENAAKPFYSVLVLAFVCSALVAAAAVGLRPQQEANRDLDRKKNILYAAGLYQEGKTIDQMFAPIETKIIELASGKFVPEETIKPESYKQLKAALSDATGRKLSNEEDIARLRRLEKYSLVYLVRQGDKIEQIILPVRGKGLWSTMYAYVALDGDLNTIRGVSFYEHGETPGLGGEVENRRWQKGWQGKEIYNDSGDIDLQFVKGKAAGEGPARLHEIDGLSGATLTTKGVNNLMEFWFGEHGFKPFFARLKKENIHG
ncbi:Na(+)-translocating NADH-quinone reductase subunit C [Desulfopila sp. IMCC35006]|uniref:Na(+)-translocating NADH-quinone reductase subunit C n=1 Tax=Desulfopila sp. IMCC35006 TaxID=2569542 RepID=UPI0010AC3BA4|nr:Na(+)-translocating NADH-quinone reductase subunit C [Desulfopila sp. IMCC35006]TKB25541.1 Na(+)-translocating NADH-quinone reductase subunit C [Desulfopila sp. IMCC35006]